jgi:hypothetical protein
MVAQKQVKARSSEAAGEMLNAQDNSAKFYKD